jgi:hypothetical protein
MLVVLRASGESFLSCQHGNACARRRWPFVFVSLAEYGSKSISVWQRRTRVHYFLVHAHLAEAQGHMGRRGNGILVFMDDMHNHCNGRHVFLHSCVALGRSDER